MGNKPLKTYRIAGVSVSVFRNENKGTDGKTFISYSAQVQKGFLDKNTGDFANTSSLNIEDMIIASMLLKKAFDEIVDQTA